MRPAMIETTTVLASISGASGGSASGAVCGFTAITSAATLPMSPLGLMRTPRLASALIAFDGCGSSTTTFFGGSLRASQPSSMAPPILPAPTSTSVPGMEARELLALRFGHDVPIVSSAMAGAIQCIRVVP